MKYSKVKYNRERSPNHEKYGKEQEGITRVFKSFSTRRASKRRTALLETVLTQHDLEAARTTQTKIHMYIDRQKMLAVVNGERKSSLKIVSCCESSKDAQKLDVYFPRLLR